MTLHVGPLPAGDERHPKALEAAVAKANERPFVYMSIEAVLAAYHRSLADQGVRFVDASEVADEFRSMDPTALSPNEVARWVERRFGGGDERA